MERIRLQRKFTIKSKVQPVQRAGLILKMMVSFWLTLILINSLLSLSFKVHINQIFTAEFWSSQHIINANLSLAICVFILLPYIVCWLAVQGSAVKDFVFTALTLHTILCLMINLKITINYVLFVIFLGIIGSILGTYGSRIREQAKLISQIQNIEMNDRKQMSLPIQQSQHAHLNLSD